MIVGNINAHILPRWTLELTNSPYTFHLTGSRYFGGATHLSDYDFFAQDSQEIKTFLARQGFYIETGSHYVGNNPLNCACVYKRGEIHIQLVQNYELKKMIHEQIIRSSRDNNHPNLIILARNFPKQHKKLLWDTLCNIALATKDSQLTQPQPVIPISQPKVTETPKVPQEEPMPKEIAELLI